MIETITWTTNKGTHNHCIKLIVTSNIDVIMKLRTTDRSWTFAIQNKSFLSLGTGLQISKEVN